MKNTIKGIIKDEKGANLSGIPISVFDVKPGKETLLEQGLTGEKGDFTINLKLGELRTNLLVRANSLKGEIIGESDIRFNVGEQEKIDFTVKMPAPSSEFEQVKWTLEKLLPDGLSSFREKDIPLLLQTKNSDQDGAPVINIANLDKSRLEHFHYSVELAQDSGLPPSFFYGISYQLNKKPTLLEILNMQEPQLRQLLQKAEEETKISEVDDFVFIQLEQLALAEGVLVQQECFGYLRQLKTKEPLAGFTVRVFDLETSPNPKELGNDVSNKNGLFTLAFITPKREGGKAKSKKRSPHRLRLHINPPGSKEMHKVEIKVAYGQKELGELLVPLSGMAKTATVKAPAPLPGFMLNNPVVQHKLRQANGKLAPDKLKNVRSMPLGETGAAPTRQDATSPLAYLADLLNYTQLHITKEGSTNISSEELRSLFFQPFNDLLTSGSLGNKEVRQIQLCIESLRAYLGERPLSDSQKESDLVAAESQYLETAYQTLLIHLGTSYEEMSQLGVADDTTKQNLANRLGIKVGQLNDFWIPTENLTEALLEHKFGLIDTIRDVLSNGAKMGDDENQIKQWQFEGIQWNKNTDEQGQIYLKLGMQVPPSGAPVPAVEIYQDAQRTQLIASGTGESSTSKVDLSESNNSGLSSSINVDFKSVNETIAISVIPAFLSARFENVHARWQQLDNPVEPEGLQFLEEQQKAAIDFLSETIGKTEIASLPLLRDALINITEQNARRLSEILLIDCEFDAKYMTTRISQAFVTIQQLFTSVRTGLLKDTHPDLKLEADDFAEEWKWIGTYETWRAAILVFLYPENLLNPSLRVEQSPIFQDLTNQLRRNRRLNLETIRKAAEEYEFYFKDICNLKVEATCQTMTQMDNVGSIHQNLFYQFGLNDGRVYWSFYDEGESANNKQSYWGKIPGFEEFKVSKILGTVPYQTSENKRKIFLFAKGFSKNWSVSRKYVELVFTTYDLQNREWEEEIVFLSLPDITYNVDVIIEHRLNEELPPFIAYRKLLQLGQQDYIFTRSLNEEGTEWEENDWKKFYLGYGGEIKKVYSILNIRFSRIITAYTKNRSNGVYRTKLFNFNLDGGIKSFSLNGEVKSTVNIGGYFLGTTIHKSMDKDSLIWYFVQGVPNSRYYPIKITKSGVEDKINLGPQHLGFFGMRELAIHNGTGVESSNEEEGMRLAFNDTQGQSGANHAFFVPDIDNMLHLQGQKTQNLPKEVTLFKLTTDHNQSSYQNRRERIENAFISNIYSPIHILNYLWEAYYFLPIYLSLQLKRNNHYVEALDYLRLVYDYTEVIEDRKIFYGLKHEENFDENYNRPGKFFSDPLNPHAIASTRVNAYTCYTLLTLVNSFLQTADGEFARDTIESLASARRLYASALELLNTPELKQEPDEEEILPFDIPQNPVLEAHKVHAEVNLYKLHTGRNIAGDEREVQPLNQTMYASSGLVVNGIESQTSTQQNISFRPTPFRFFVLLERAKQLVSLAQQLEVSFLSTLEKLETTQLNLINAKNDLQLSKATIRLQDFRVKDAVDSVKLVELQRTRIEITQNYYQGLIADGLSNLETAYLTAQTTAAALLTISAIYEALKTAISFGLSGDPLGKAGSAAQAFAQVYQSKASFERRKQEWVYQSILADQDLLIGNQQILISKDQVKIVGQERKIASLRFDHTESVANFLENKFLNEELYDWMSNVLEDVYSFFLQQATATARLAVQQLAFERQEPVPSIILSDYWEVPKNGQNGLNPNETTDRKGLTGSSRLLQDIYKLDQIAFQTDRRKLQMTKTISLLQLSPAEFQRFKEKGVFLFSTPMDLFDRDFPGHYLRMIKRVRVSVIALTSPIEGIHATLTSNGISRIVLANGSNFLETEIKHPPESVSLSMPINATGLFELQPEDQTKMLPFESMGVDTFWEFEMPKASNSFDFNTIADVLFTIEYTALNSPDYRQQVIQKLDRQFSADRAFSFRHEFADQWYDLNNPDQTVAPMTVQFDTRRADFPPNLEGLSIKHIVLYFSRKEGVEEITINHLKFTPKDSEAQLGADNQNVTSVNGILSTRSGNIQAWDPFITGNKAPYGIWELSLSDTDEMKQQFKKEDIEDILFVITYEGMTPEWPN